MRDLWMWMTERKERIICEIETVFFVNAKNFFFFWLVSACLVVCLISIRLLMLYFEPMMPQAFLTCQTYSCSFGLRRTFRFISVLHPFLSVVCVCLVNWKGAKLWIVFHIWVWIWCVASISLSLQYLTRLVLYHRLCCFSFVWNAVFANVVCVGEKELVTHN